MASTSPHNIDLMLKTAISRARGGDHSTARQMLKQILSVEPDDARAWMWLAFTTPVLEEKRVALRKAIALRPNDRRIQDVFQQVMTPNQVQKAAQHGVFMGYARADELFTLDLTDSLRSAGVNVWMDMTDVPDTANWHNAIARAMRSCGVMLLVISPAALQSADLHSEWEWFMSSGKVIIPVIHQRCDFSHLNIHHPPVDFRQDYRLGLQTLLRLLLAADTKTVTTPLS